MDLEQSEETDIMKIDKVGCNYATILAVMAIFYDLQYFY